MASIWHNHIHSGWRQACGIALIIIGVAGAGLYYWEWRTVAQLTVNASPQRAAAVATNASSTTTKSAKSSTSPSPEATTKQSGKIKLSTATQAELESLPGIGPSKAKAIIDYRETHPFKSVNDLDKVKGIGPKTLEKLKPLIEL